MTYLHTYFLQQIVHKNLIDEVVKRLISAYKQVKIGNPLEKGNLCGPLHTTAAVEAYKEAISEAAALVSPSVGYFVGCLSL